MSGNSGDPRGGGAGDPSGGWGLPDGSGQWSLGPEQRNPETRYDPAPNAAPSPGRGFVDGYDDHDFAAPVDQTHYDYGAPVGQTHYDYGPPVAQTHYDYGAPADGPRRESGGSGGKLLPLLLGVVALLMIALIVLGGFMFLGDDGDSAATAENSAPGGATSTVTETATATQEAQPSTSAPATSTSVPRGSDSSDRYVAGAGEYGVGLNTWKFCDSGGASATMTGSKTTSCPFAENVGSKLAGVAVSEGSSKSVTAYSPVTRENVTLSCRKAQDSELTFLWKCEGGRNAVVYVYP